MSINITAPRIIQRGDLNGHYEGSLFTLDLQISQNSPAAKKLPTGMQAQ